MNLEAMAMKGYSAFPKDPALLKPHNQIVSCHIQDSRLGWGSYSSAEMQSVYSTAPAGWVSFKRVEIFLLRIVT